MNLFSPACLALLVLLAHAGIVSAADNTTAVSTPAIPTTTVTTGLTTSATTEPDRTGGSISFETHPPGATIWVNNIEIGASPLTYYFEKTGTFHVVIQKKGYVDYTDKVTVNEGKRDFFSAVLTPVSYDLTDTSVPVVQVTTVPTLRKSTMSLPTPWPTSPQNSPVDPALVIGAAALGTGFAVLQRR
jgi:hypothetical protein